MTDVQWLFHYHEAVAEEKEKIKSEINIVKAIITTISNAADKVSAFTNPKLYSRMNEEFQKQKMFGDMSEEKADNVEKVLTETEKAIEDGYNQFLSLFPEELFVEDNTRDRLLPKISKEELYKRNPLGINKQIKNGD